MDKTFVVMCYDIIISYSENKPMIWTVTGVSLNMVTLQIIGLALFGPLSVSCMHQREALPNSRCLFSVLWFHWCIKGRSNLISKVIFGKPDSGDEE